MKGLCEGSCRRPANSNLYTWSWVHEPVNGGRSRDCRSAPGAGHEGACPSRERAVHGKERFPESGHVLRHEPRSEEALTRPSATLSHPASAGREREFRWGGLWNVLVKSLMGHQTASAHAGTNRPRPKCAPKPTAIGPLTDSGNSMTNAAPLSCPRLPFPSRRMVWN